MSVGTAILLAGGKGSRLAPWPAPKCLLPLHGIPIIERLISHLENQTVDGIVVCTGYRAKDVEAAVAHRVKGVPLRFSNAGEEAGMGQRLLQARSDFRLDDQRVLVCFADEIADIDLQAMLRRHIVSRSLLTYAACEQLIPFGVVRADGKICDQEQVLVHIGFAICEPLCWNDLKPEDGVSDWINRVREQHTVHYYIHDGKRATVNSVAELHHAERIWA